MKQHSFTKIEAIILNLLEEAFALRVNNLKQSITFTLEALELSKQSCNQSLIAKSFSRLAFYYMIQGDYNQSISLANNAEAIYELLDDEVGLADAKYTIASVYYKSDNLQLGLKYLLECLVIFSKHNDYLSIAKVYKSVGVIYEYFGDVQSAKEGYKSSIEAAEMIGDVNMMTNVYNPLSGLYLNEDMIDEAMDLIQKSITLKTQSQDIRGLAFAYYGRGKVYAKKGEYQLAEDDYKEAIEIHMQMGEKLGQGIAFQKLAVLYFMQERFEESKEFAFKALEFSIIYKSRMVKTKASYLLYEIYKKQENIADALVYLEVHHAELQANVHSQTFQIIDSYKMIHNMAARALQDKLDVEKNEMLEKKNKAELIAKAKQDFLSNMSHEIRTPLNAVTTITTLLKERADSEDQQLLESLKFSSNNLMLLINDILDFTKLETDKIQLENRPSNIRDLLTNIKNTYESLAKEKGLKLSLDVDYKIEKAFELDEMKLAQILGNLINNAIKFTDTGGVRIEVKQVSNILDNSRIQFNVIDTGIGIPDDFLGEIFDTFTQPKSVTTKTKGGSGLGLAIVKKLTALYGSEVTIQTEIGKGSTFSFVLSLKATEQKILTTQKINSQLNELNVLLVEDNKINMLVATKLLSRWGIKADFAVNGIDALAKAAEKKYDIILMDIHMPELNGYDATQKLRLGKGINKNTTVYAFTADIVANIQSEYVKYFDGFLRKPIEVNELYAALSSAVSVEVA